MSLRIVLISDTHELHREAYIPPGDLLIHAGDVTFFSQRHSVLDDFNDWLGELPHPHKVIVPGNHDTLLENLANRARITNAHLLVNSGTEVAGLKIWGSPMTHYADQAFGVADPLRRRHVWAFMPDKLDILVTHIPPYEVLDRPSKECVHAGDVELHLEILRKRPRLHVFGHVHGCRGTYANRNTFFVNASVAGEFGDLDSGPVVIGMNPK